MAISILAAPIAGQSLTTQPKNNPWENPPQLDTVEETLMFYTKHLSKPDVVDDLMVMLEVGFPVKPLARTIRTTGVMKGTHTLDVGLLVEPALVKFITATADSLGVPYEMGGPNTDEEKAQREKDKISMLLTAALSRADRTAEEDEGVALMQEISDNLDVVTEEEEMTAEPEMEAAPEMEEQPAAPEGAGLMARGQ